MVTAQQLQAQQTQLDNFTTRIEDALKNLQTSTESGKTELSGKIDGISARLDGYDAKLDVIDRKVQSTDDRLGNLHAEVGNQGDIARAKFEEMAKKIADLEEKVAVLDNVQDEIDHLAEKVEDRTNRQLRETLIFKNIPEDGDEESYQQSKELIATTISTHCEDITYEYALSQVKRAHREQNRYEGDHIRAGKRFIFAALHSWDLCQLVIETFREKNINDPLFTIHADQKYGPLTTKRRQLAFLQRKQLKDAGTITSGYVSFPAKLMVNFPGELNRGKKIYKLHTNFSRVKI